MSSVPDDLKTCALCEHCSLDLGYQGWSEWTPGSPGDVDCLKGHSPHNDDSDTDVLGRANKSEISPTKLPGPIKAIVS